MISWIDGQPGGKSGGENMAVSHLADLRARGEEVLRHLRHHTDQHKDPDYPYKHLSHDEL